MGVCIPIHVSARHRLSELLVEAALGLVCERECWLADNDGRGLEAHLFPFEVALKRVEEEAIVWDRVPVHA